MAGFMAILSVWSHSQRLQVALLYHGDTCHNYMLQKQAQAGFPPWLQIPAYLASIDQHCRLAAIGEFATNKLCAVYSPLALWHHAVFTPHRHCCLCCFQLLCRGPGDTNLLPRLLIRARHSQLCMINGGTNQMDAIFIDNAVEAHILAIEQLRTQVYSVHARVQPAQCLIICLQHMHNA